MYCLDCRSIASSRLSRTQSRCSVISGASSNTTIKSGGQNFSSHHQPLARRNRIRSSAKSLGSECSEKENRDKMRPLLDPVMTARRSSQRTLAKPIFPPQKRIADVSGKTGVSEALPNSSAFRRMSSNTSIGSNRGSMTPRRLEVSVYNEQQQSPPVESEEEPGMSATEIAQRVLAETWPQRAALEKMQRQSVQDLRLKQMQREQQEVQNEQKLSPSRSTAFRPAVPSKPSHLTPQAILSDNAPVEINIALQKLSLANDTCTTSDTSHDEKSEKPKLKNWYESDDSESPPKHSPPKIPLQRPLDNSHYRSEDYQVCPAELMQRPLPVGKCDSPDASPKAQRGQSSYESEEWSTEGERFYEDQHRDTGPMKHPTQHPSPLRTPGSQTEIKQQRPLDVRDRGPYETRHDSRDQRVEVIPNPLNYDERQDFRRPYQMNYSQRSSAQTLGPNYNQNQQPPTYFQSEMSSYNGQDYGLNNDFYSDTSVGQYDEVYNPAFKQHEPSGNPPGYYHVNQQQQNHIPNQQGDLKHNGCNGGQKWTPPNYRQNEMSPQKQQVYPPNTFGGQVYEQQPNNQSRLFEGMHSTQC